MSVNNVVDNFETLALDESIVKTVRTIKIVARLQLLVTFRNGGLILLPHVGSAQSRIQH